MLRIEKRFADEMIAHSLADDPNECCGILAAQNGSVVKLYRVTNSEKSPYRFSMDPKELYQTYREIDDNHWELLVIYHSHTHSPAYPSATDIRLASWPEARYIIISLQDKTAPQMRAFRIVDSQVTEEELVVE